MQKTIVIFANSVKNLEHCVAGKDVFTRKWVRPVSDTTEEKELTSKQCTCRNSDEPVKLLQIIDINLLRHEPSKPQPENYLISNEEWVFSNSINREEVFNYLDSPKNLWLDGGKKNDSVDYSLIETGKIQIHQSLYLIKVEKIHIYWKDRSEWNKRPQRRGKFKYNNIEYDLAITDPKYEEYKEQDIFWKFLCISLTAEFNGFCYKIIASIF